MIKLGHVIKFSWKQFSGILKECLYQGNKNIHAKKMVGYLIHKSEIPNSESPVASIDPNKENLWMIKL